MATLAEAVRSVLLADSAVTAIIGSGTDAPVHWNRRDQGGTIPAIVLTAAGGEPDDLDLAGNADFQESRIQCACLAASYLQARALAKAATDALMNAADTGGVNFWAAERERPIDLGSDTVGGVFVHEVTQDVILRHSPSA